MRNAFYALTCMTLIALACSSSGSSTIPAADPGIIQTIIVSTAVAAQNQTQLANPPISTPLPTETFMPALSETPSGPLSLVYEGLTISCACSNCMCLTNVTITVRITIDPQGSVAGILEQYLPDTSDMMLVGTKGNMLGASQGSNPKGEVTYDFIGSINENLSQLAGTISFAGTNEDGTAFSGKRELLLFRK